MNRFWVAMILLAGFPGMVNPEASAANSCVDCHQQTKTIEALPAWYQDPFIHWTGSVHGKNQVSCEKCHGGNPSKTEKQSAHQGLKASRDPGSPTHFKNLPETCGSCHKKVYQHFVRSRHYINLKTDRLAPTCTTCHGFQMDLHGVSPLEIAGRCRICHNLTQGVKPEISELAMDIMEEIVQINRVIQKTRLAIELARERGIGTEESEESLKAASLRLKQTGALWHKFNLGPFKKELSEVRAQANQAYESTRNSLTKK